MATQREKIILEGEDRASQAFNKARGSFQGMDDVIKKAAAVGGIAIGVTKLIDLAGAAYKSAVDAREAGAAFATTFGPALGQASAFVDDFANKAGFATYELEQMLAVTGNVVQGIGATEQESFALSQRMATLAGDVASFSNAAGGAQAVMQALQSAINGEREALKTYGLAVSEVEVQQAALAATGKTNVDELTRLDKALATVEVAYSKAGKAVGDLDRTQDSAANTQRRIMAKLKEAGVELGEILLQAFEKVYPTIEALIPTFSNVINSVGKLVAAVGPLANILGKVLGPALNAVAGYLDLVNKGLLSIQSAWDPAAAATLRMGEATDFLTEAMANGEDPAVALANALNHVAENGELTSDKFETLAALSGLSEDAILAVQQAMLEYTRSGNSANTTTGELITAFGTAAGTAYEYEDAGLRMIRMEREAAAVARDELSPAMKALNDRLYASKTAAIEAGKAFRTEVAAGILQGALSIDEAVEELDISLGKGEARLLENITAEMEWRDNLNRLAAEGFTDLATFLEEQGIEMAGIVGDMVADLEEAASWEAIIDQAERDSQALADGWATAVENPDATLLQHFYNFGVKLSDLVEAGFSQTDLSRTLNALMDQAQGAVTPSGPVRTNTGAPGSEVGATAFHAGGLVPGGSGSLVSGLLHGGEVVVPPQGFAALAGMIAAEVGAAIRGASGSGSLTGSGGPLIGQLVLPGVRDGADGNRIGKEIEAYLANSQLLRLLPEVIR